MRISSGLWCASGLLLVLSCSSDPTTKNVVSPPGGQGGAAEAGAGGPAGGNSAGSNVGGSGGAVGAAGTASPAGGVAGANSSAAGADSGAAGADSGAAGADSSAAGQGGSSDGIGDVTGTLVDEAGRPVPANTIEIAGAVVITDANGEFRVPSVPARYDATVVNEDRREVDTYEGLRTRAPKFRLGVLITPKSASILGHLSGGVGFPTPVGHKLALTASDSDPSLAAQPLTTVGPAYQFNNLGWAGPDADTFTVSALQWSVDGSGRPTGYDGWASKQITVTNGAMVGKTDGSTAATNLALTSVVTRTVTGSITTPAGCALDAFSGVGALLIFDDASVGATYSYLLPRSLPGVDLSIGASCSFTAADPRDNDSSTVVAGLDAANAVDLTVTKPPKLSLPIRAATGITSSSGFQWVAGDSPLNVVFFTTADLWTIRRYSTTTRSTFPDLSRFGIPFPKGGEVTWQVVNIGPGTTADDALASGLTAVKPGERDWFANSAARTFTTAP